MTTPSMSRLPTESFLRTTEVPYEDIGGLLPLFDKIVFRANLLLSGPKGLGKSSAVLAYATRNKIPLVTFDCSEDVRRGQLLGHFVVRGKETPFVAGPIPVAYDIANECGQCILLFEEINALSPAMQKVLNPVADFRSRVEIPEANLVVSLQKNAKLWVVGTMNPSTYGGVHSINEDLKSRFRIKGIPYPAREQELQAVLKALGWSAKDSAKSSTVTQAIRLALESRQPGVEYALSTRDVVQLCEDIELLGRKEALSLLLGKWEDSDLETMRARIKSIFGDAVLGGAVKKIPKKAEKAAVKPQKISAEQREVLHRTAAIFSGLTQKKLFVREAPSAANVGECEIHVPMSDPDHYTLLERELSHILFGTRAGAIQAFAERYTQRASTIATARNKVIDTAKLTALLTGMATVLEHHRVRSLWDALYPGSAQALQRRELQDLEKALSGKDCLDSVLDYMNWLRLQPTRRPPPSEYERWDSILKDALRTVERKSFRSSLAITKIALMRMIEDLLQDPSQQPGGGGGGGGSQDPPDDTAETSQQQAPSAKSSSDQESKAADEDKRLDALQKILDSSGAPSEATSDICSHSRPDRVERSETRTQNQQQAQDIVSQETEELEKSLDASQAEAEEHLKQIEDRIAPKQTDIEFLKKDANATVRFTDTIDLPQEVPALPPQARALVSRLHTLFSRVVARKKNTLEEEGVSIDPEVVAESLHSYEPPPFFKHDVLTRGFRILLLVDGSASMQGMKFAQVQHAVRVLRRALDFPFVRFDLWVFHSDAAGVVTIHRTSKHPDIILAPSLKPHGLTPLHAAVSCAKRALMEGPEVKFCLVLSDGEPAYRTVSGVDVPSSVLVKWTAKEVQQARRQGIEMGALQVGEITTRQRVTYALTPKEMRFMFGSRFFLVHPLRLQKDLIKHVTSLFVHYLKQG